MYVAKEMAIDPLSLLAAHHGTDKWGVHFYTPVYHELLGHLRLRPVRVLEIGIGGYDNPDCGGLSLLMWRDYFPYGQIFGLDKAVKDLPKQNQIEVIRGDQASASDLKALVEEHGPFDIILDDGSHRPEHVVFTFEQLFPALKPDGFYIVEDTQTSHLDMFGGAHPAQEGKSAIRYFASIAEDLNYREIVRFEPSWQPHPFASRIQEIRFLHNLVIVRAGKNRDPSNLGSMQGEPSLLEALALLENYSNEQPPTPFMRLSQFLIEAHTHGAPAAVERFPDEVLDAVLALDVSELQNHGELLVSVERRLREGHSVHNADRVLMRLQTLFPNNRAFLLAQFRTLQGEDLNSAFRSLADQLNTSNVQLELPHFHLLAERLLAAGLPEQVVEACTFGLERFPGNPALRLNRAEAYLCLGIKDKARADLERNSGGKYGHERVATAISQL